jgi:hypothetical protein
MIFVKDLVGVFCFQDLPFVMALEARIILYLTITGDHVRVTGFALHAPFHKLFMIEVERVNLDIASCLKMTGCTSGKELFLPFSFLEMTDKAVLFCYCYVCSLDNLRVTGSTS